MSSTQKSDVSGVHCAALAVAFVALLATAAAADPIGALAATQSLKCTFTVGNAANWAERLSPSIEKDSISNALHFDSIDSEAQTARFIGNAGSTDVVLMASSSGMTFVEMTPLGGLIITTVFPSYARGTSRFIAVHSRHIPGLSIVPPTAIPPIASQFHGTCERFG